MSGGPNRAWLRIARRELAGGLGGFWIYLACLARGAWAIAAAGSITASFGRGLEIQSHALLGGARELMITIGEFQAAVIELEAQCYTRVIRIQPRERGL